MMTSMGQFEKRWQLETAPANAPIFVLSAGWRSGSTLLQRLVCSSKDTLVWGEAYARCELIQRLHQASKALGDHYPHQGHFPDWTAANPIEDQWIANLFPPPQSLKNSFRSALDTLLAQPAQERGFARFGLKEVRLDAEEGRFLQWLYPDARFLLLCRNPWDAWRSAKRLELYLHWPDTPIKTPTQFAEHWLRLVESFAQWKDPNVFFFRYEDLLTHPKALEAVANHCGLRQLNPAVLNRVVGSSRTQASLSANEIDAIQEVAGATAKALGYHPTPVSAAA